MYTQVALVSGQPRDAKKVSVTGAHGRLRELFSSWPLGGGGGGEGVRWSLTRSCPITNKHWECKKKKTEKNFVIVCYNVVLTIF